MLLDDGPAHVPDLPRAGRAPPRIRCRRLSAVRRLPAARRRPPDVSVVAAGGYRYVVRPHGATVGARAADRDHGARAAARRRDRRRYRRSSTARRSRASTAHRLRQPRHCAARVRSTAAAAGRRPAGADAEAAADRRTATDDVASNDPTSSERERPPSAIGRSRIRARSRTSTSGSRGCSATDLRSRRCRRACDRRRPRRS